jgi:hypothetical protein
LTGTSFSAADQELLQKDPRESKRDTETLECERRGGLLADCSGEHAVEGDVDREAKALLSITRFAPVV